MRGAWVVVVLGACGGDPRRAAIAEGLLEPYAAAIRAEDWATARGRLSTPRRASQVGEVAFLAAQAGNRERWGALVALRLQKEAIEPAGDPDCPACVRVFVAWEGERASGEVALDVVEDGGAWKIERSWLWPSGGIGVQRVF
jgi:hypothetical protein